VLCVGDQGGTSVAQQVIEMAGGHFLHHGGDDRQEGAALEASLVADLVICQAGCVSHDAYAARPLPAHRQAVRVGRAAGQLVRREVFSTSRSEILITTQIPTHRSG
jgi:hypothetical protein